MKPYTKVYLRHFGYGEQDFIPCEICMTKAVDIHHIRGRGIGKDTIENLMALCRDHHTEAHDEILSEQKLIAIHNKFIGR